MSEKSFRWRTVLEVAVISVVIYIFLGAPGISNSFSQPPSEVEDHIPAARAKAESLVYPDLKNIKCAEHSFDIHVFSTNPLVIYIDGFLSQDETKHLVEIR
jgi:prolyl 4-hydroxylase